MPQPISVQSSSLLIQNALGRAQQAMSTASLRLSTGSRVNSAKDDPVAFSAAVRIDSQITGVNQFVKNANDAISSLQIAESALQKIADNLQRMKEISAEAANASTTTDERSALQTEMTQLSSEIDRIANETSLNGVNIFSDGSQSLSFNVGDGSSGNINFSYGVDTDQLSLNTSNESANTLQSGRLSTSLGGLTINQGDLTIDGNTLPLKTFKIYDQNNPTAFDIAVDVRDYLNANLGGVLTTTAYNNYVGSVATGVTSGTLIINGVAISTSNGIDDLINKINQQVTDITASLNSQGGITLSNATGETIVVSGTVTNSGLTAGVYPGYLTLTPITSNGFVNINTSTNNITRFLAYMGLVNSSNSSNLSGAAIGGVLSGGPLIAGDVKVNGVNIGASISGSAKDKATAINVKSADTHVTATAINSVSYTINPQNVPNVGVGVQINGVTLTLGANALQAQDVSNAINSNTTLNNLNISSVVANGQLVVTASQGEDITVTNGPGPGVLFNGIGAGRSQTTSGHIQLVSNNNKPIVLEGSVANLWKIGFVNVGGADADISNGLKVSSTSWAQNAATKIDAALTTIQSNLGSVGALQSRLGATVSNLQDFSTNLSDAKSNLVDTDFSAEVAAFTQAQILQNAGISILAQANANMQSILALLK